MTSKRATRVLEEFSDQISPTGVWRRCGGVPLKVGGRKKPIGRPGTQSSGIDFSRASALLV
jgi:hypothetical protein